MSDARGIAGEGFQVSAQDSDSFRGGFLDQFDEKAKKVTFKAPNGSVKFNFLPSQVSRENNSISTATQQFLPSYRINHNGQKFGQKIGRSTDVLASRDKKA